MSGLVAALQGDGKRSDGGVGSPRKHSSNSLGATSVWLHRNDAFRAAAVFGVLLQVLELAFDYVNQTAAIASCLCARNAGRSVRQASEESAPPPRGRPARTLRAASEPAQRRCRSLWPTSPAAAEGLGVAVESRSFRGTPSVPAVIDRQRSTRADVSREGWGPEDARDRSAKTRTTVRPWDREPVYVLRAHVPNWLAGIQRGVSAMRTTTIATSSEPSTGLPASTGTSISYCKKVGCALLPSPYHVESHTFPLVGAPLLGAPDLDLASDRYAASCPRSFSFASNSACVPVPLARLHAPHSNCRFWMWSEPPRARGIT